MGNRDNRPPGSAQEGLLIAARLKVQVDVLRRAQAIAPDLADELQTTIDEIEQQLRALRERDRA